MLFKFPPKCYGLTSKRSNSSFHQNALQVYRYIVQQHHKYFNIIDNKQSTAFLPQNTLTNENRVVQENITNIVNSRNRPMWKYRKSLTAISKRQKLRVHFLLTESTKNYLRNHLLKLNKSIQYYKWYKDKAPIQVDLWCTRKATSIHQWHIYRPFQMWMTDLFSIYVQILQHN
jgi:hypothetical protein